MHVRMHGRMDVFVHGCKDEGKDLWMDGWIGMLLLLL